MKVRLRKPEIRYIERNLTDPDREKPIPKQLTKALRILNKRIALEVDHHKNSRYRVINKNK